jgi:type VI secretion system protein VasJ
MLGLMKSSRAWMWAACGKHPAARDFFRIGQEFPLLKIFSGWVEDGYGKLAQKNGPSTMNSWRFWARGAVKESLICGLVRDSSDGIGRNYPLLIMGTGQLAGWEDKWDLVPLAFEKIWSEMEYMTTQNFNDLKKLETDVKNIPEPQPEWRAYQSRQDAFCGDANAFPTVSDFAPEKKENFVSLDQGLHHDQNLLISRWHSLFRNRVAVIPNAVFMGGSFGKSFIGFYQRPLASADFIQLWTADAHVENGRNNEIG